MEKTIRITATILLIINGLSGIAGGYGLAADPSGDVLRMPLEFLSGSPFRDFLIPGLVLLICIGVSSLVVAYLVVNQYKHAPLLLICQGITVWIWLLVQIAIIKTLDPLQLVYGLIALALVLCGLVTKRKTPIPHT